MAKDTLTLTPIKTETPPYPKPLDTTVEPLFVRCALCGDEGRATVYRVRIGPMPEVTWIRMPDGWWLLLHTFVVGLELDKLHCRCRSCLRCGIDTAEASAALPTPNKPVYVSQVEVNAEGLRSAMWKAMLEAEKSESEDKLLHVLGVLASEARMSGQESSTYLQRLTGKPLPCDK